MLMLKYRLLCGYFTYDQQTAHTILQHTVAKRFNLWQQARWIEDRWGVCVVWRSTRYSSTLLQKKITEI